MRGGRRKRMGRPPSECRRPLIETCPLPWLLVLFRGVNVAVGNSLEQTGRHRDAALEVEHGFAGEADPLTVEGAEEVAAAP
jgi:hypothetical protein